MASEETTGAVLEINGLDLNLKNLIKKTQTVAPETSDVVLMDLELTAGTDLEVTDYYVNLTGIANFEEDSVFLYVDGVDYPITKNGKTSFTKKSERFQVTAGDKISIQVRGDSSENATGTLDKIEFGINEVKNLENNNTVTPSPAVTEKGHTTKFAGGTVKVKSLVNSMKNKSNTIDEGEINEVLKFSVKASNEKLTVKEMTFSIS